MTSPRPGDEATAPAPDASTQPMVEERSPLERSLLWGSVALISIVAFETLAVTTAMPSIAADLDGMAQYPLAFGVALAAQLFTTPLAGHLSDRWGARPALLIGLSLFVGGLLLCGFAPTMSVLVLGRLVQGLGGGFLVVPLYVLVGALVPPSRRPAFFAAFAAAWVVPSMVGPPLAGIVVEQWDWHWIFLGVAPLTVLATLVLVPIMRHIPGPVGEQDAAPAQSRKRQSPRRLILAALGTGIAAAFLQALSAGVDAAEGAGAWAVTIGLVAVALGVLYVSLPALLPAGTLRFAPGLPSVVSGRALLNGAFISAEIFLPLMLQQLHGWRPSHAGWVLTVGSVTWALGSAIQARVTRDDKRRTVVSLSPLLMVAGMAITALAVLSTPWLALLGWGIAGLGIGLSFPALSVIALAVTPRSQHGSMSSSLQIADTLGAALSIALIGTIVALTAGWGAWSFILGLALAGGLAALAAVAGSRTLPRPAHS